MDENIKQCPDCLGEGKIPISENRVSMDMAIDAGDRRMAGMFHSYNYVECESCNGSGFLEIVAYDTQPAAPAEEE